MAGIKLQNLVKDYGSVRAVHGVDLSIEDGEFVVFVGPSGCGKSTLLRMIAGLEDITSGTLMIGDQVVNMKEPRDRDVAMVFQDYALYPHMSVADNIGFGLKMRKVAGEDIAAAVKNASEMLQIEHLLDRKPGQLSGGQRQRVAMGRAIVRQPAVFLFDEPLSNLDAKLRVDMRTQIKRMHEMLKTTTVYVTHDQVEALTLADRIVILRDGVIEQQGAPIEVYTEPANRFVGEFIGSPQMNIFSGVLQKSGQTARLAVGDQKIDIGKVNASEGAELLLGIRPEHFEVNGSNPVISGIVDVIEPLGSDTMIVCQAGGVEFSARIPADLPVAKGQKIEFSVDASRLHIFHGHSGKRVS